MGYFPTNSAGIVAACCLGVFISHVTTAAAVGGGEREGRGCGKEMKEGETKGERRYWAPVGGGDIDLIYTRSVGGSVLLLFE